MVCGFLLLGWAGGHQAERRGRLASASRVPIRARPLQWLVRPSGRASAVAGRESEGGSMAQEWEITGRLGEIQLEWLRQHYSQEQLDEALARLPKKGFPLNVAKRLQASGGPAMPPPMVLLEADPEACQRASTAREQALARLRELARRT